MARQMRMIPPQLPLSFWRARHRMEPNQHDCSWSRRGLLLSAVLVARMAVREGGTLQGRERFWSRLRNYGRDIN